MQTQHSNIEIQGIMRALADSAVQDGACQEVINLRKKNGAWEPTHPKQSTLTIDDSTGGYPLDEILDITKHSPTPENYFVVTLDHDGSHKVFFGDITAARVEPELIDLESETFQKVIPFQNFIIVVSDQNRYFFLYDPDNTAYTRLNSIPYPDLMAEGINNTGYSPAAGADFEEARSNYYKTRHEAETVDGKTEGHVLVRAAWKLFDGSFIRYTAPFHIHLGSDGQISYDTDTKEITGVSFGNYRIITNFTTDEKDTLEKYKGLIRSLCVFSTDPVKYWNVDADLSQWDTGTIRDAPLNDHTQVIEKANYYKIKEYDVDEIINYEGVQMESDIEYDSNLRVQETLPVNDFTNHSIIPNAYFRYNSRLHYANIKQKLFEGYPLNKNVSTIQIKDIELDNFVSNQAFNIVLKNTGAADVTADIDWYLQTPPYDPADSNIYSGTKSSVTVSGFSEKTIQVQQAFDSLEAGARYIMRVESDFWYREEEFDLDGSRNYTSTHWKEDGQLSDPTGSDYTYYAEVSLNDNEKEKIVRTPLNAAVGTDNTLTLPPVLSYPDVRAFKMRIVAEDGSGNYAELLTVNLNNHPYLNLAYYVNYDSAGAIASITKDPANFTFDDSLTTIDDTVLQSNRIQVSGFQNPLVLPAELSYRVGERDTTVLGMDSVNMPLSEGQHGQFPLYVFTDKGIWTLEKGQDVLYAFNQPLNREVCINPETITNIGQAIIFLAEDGLKMISGKDVQKISAPLEAEKFDGVLNNNTLQGYTTKSYLVNLYDHLSTQSAEAFLKGPDDAANQKGVIIGFDPLHREIIVSNPSTNSSNNLIFNYSYVYRLENSTWYKIDQNFDVMINDYPNVLGKNGNEIYNLTFEDETTTPHCLIITRPVKLGSYGRKQTKRLAARGHYIIKDGTYGSAYIFGTIDELNYFMLRGKRPEGTYEYDDIMIERSPASFKYAALVLAGQFKTGTRIRGFETRYFFKYASRLR